MNRDEESNSKCLVVGNPRLPSAVAEQWGWSDIPYAAQEASLIGEIMQVGVWTNLNYMRLGATLRFIGFALLRQRQKG